jgi:uncharacterized protein (TIGR00255 family)
MTGFGEAHLEHADQSYTLELRTVNNRYFKASIHLPDEFAFLESDVERHLRERLQRGTVTLRMHTRSLSARSAPQLNLAAIRQYVEQLTSAVPPGAGIGFDLATLALLPGVAQTRDLSQQEREEAWKLLGKLLDSAVAALTQMRRTEGQALAQELHGHTQQIRRHLAAIQQRAPLVVVEYRDRLLARVNQLLAGSGISLATPDVLKEVSVYADRSDITEEIARLLGHLDQFDAYMASPEPAGRKLEFIAQEMMREANTMGSKTGDIEIARAIIEIKSLVDRIKEQVQNIE